MIVVAVTGGVACGKSTFCRRFQEIGGDPGAVSFFSCDEEVKRVSSDPEVARALDDLARVHGGGESPASDRTAFRELLFENSEFRGKVEGLLHPLVLQGVKRQVAALSGRVQVLLVEVPLLYEVGFPLEREIDVAVVSTRREQLRRLVEERHLSPSTARRILDSQLPIEEKIKKADIVVWNDGSLAAFEAQADHLQSRCHLFCRTHD